MAPRPSGAAGSRATRPANHRAWHPAGGSAGRPPDTARRTPPPPLRICGPPPSSTPTLGAPESIVNPDAFSVAAPSWIFAVDRHHEVVALPDQRRRTTAT